MQFAAGPSVIIFALIAFATLLEVLVPLRGQPRNGGGRLLTNVEFILTTLGLGLLLNGVLAASAAYLHGRGQGLLPWLGIEGFGATVIALVVLDLAAYGVHVFMQLAPKVPRGIAAAFQALARGVSSPCSSVCTMNSP